LRTEYFKTELNACPAVQKITIKGNQVHKTIKLFLKLCSNIHLSILFDRYWQFSQMECGNILRLVLKYLFLFTDYKGIKEESNRSIKWIYNICQDGSCVWMLLCVLSSDLLSELSVTRFPFHFHFPSISNLFANTMGLCVPVMYAIYQC